MKPSDLANYEKREVMIPMRDGVKLHTVILVPKGAKHAPILLTRTPYNASKRAGARRSRARIARRSPPTTCSRGGDYIRVYQDVRGKYGSEGDYVMTRPLRGPLNDSTVDHSTDAYDTIDWLVKNVKETNGKVGMIGSSYEGFTVLMALVHPHPALKAAVPECPMVDGWRGDDWFHNGAFRNTNLDYFYGQTGQKGEGEGVAARRVRRLRRRTCARARPARSRRRTASISCRTGTSSSEHPAYDAYWQGQALDQDPREGAAHGADAARRAASGIRRTATARSTSTPRSSRRTRRTTRCSSCSGRGATRGANGDGSTLGPLKFDGDTAHAFRRDVLKPFLDARLLGTKRDDRRR